MKMRNSVPDEKYIKGIIYPAARQSTLLDYVTKYSHLIMNMMAKNL